MSHEMHTELAEIWDYCERDDTLRVAVLARAGDKFFSVGQDLVGQDLSELSVRNQAENSQFRALVAVEIVVGRSSPRDST
jgi:enoyl-CoA hydratase/carnithine racemase